MLLEEMTSTEDIAFDRFLAAGTADDALGYPNGAQFIPADREWAAAAARHALHHERRPVVIVTEDHELVLYPGGRPLLRRG